MLTHNECKNNDSNYCKTPSKSKCYANNNCGPCENNNDCNHLAFPICNYGACVTCTSDAECVNNPFGPLCVGGMGCHECRSNEDCPEGKFCDYSKAYTCQDE